MKKFQRKKLFSTMRISVEKIAEKKAKSNCMGLFYEPIKPSNLANETRK